MESNSLVEHIDRLPKIPKVVQELIELVNSQGVELHQIADKIAYDQVISARVLRLSNSAYFGRARSVGSIHEAVVRLGLGPVRTVVVSSALMSAFEIDAEVDIDAFWQHTFEVATLSKALACSLRMDGNEAFTAGMLHNLGELLMMATAAEKLDRISQHIESGKPKQEAQKLILGVTSAELGGELAQSWDFPERLSDAIRYQFSPVHDEQFSSLAGILRLAGKIDAAWGDLETTDAKREWLDQQLEYNILGLPNSVVASVDEIIGSGREMARMLK
ncbi:HDOD domain-containing protein [Salinivibrio sp. ES.052]|uniref:HDOD domain-containing protein n=1 Tax=Salinivibrio sp. ES.052 TaxID=1882823 RepID=UPI000928623B|nr:HDOD domain-containing protein [Salinivibrio sp. ES.052]SIN86271.1 HD-like signal output (HDOD) domain, no enzymatic activity [Salinivibrio sp. ES.052]